MAKHKTFFGKVFGSLWDFLKSAFESANHSLLETLVLITNKVKEALNSGTVDFLTSVIPTDIDDKLVALLRKQLPKVISSELLVKMAVDQDLTEEEAKENAEQILALWGGLSDADKAEFYTSLTAKMYIFVQKHEHGEDVTFGEGASFGEAAWKAWLKSQEKEADNDKF